MQAVTTGACRAVEFIKKNIKLDGAAKASVADSKKVVEICTQYAQKGMFNIFLTVFFGTLAFAFVEPYFFIGYLVSIALFGLYQAIRSEEHTSELQSLMRISYAVFCLKKKNIESIRTSELLVYPSTSQIY